MIHRAFSESVVEDAALAWLESLACSIMRGPNIAPDEIAAERDDYAQVVLADRPRQTLARLNEDPPSEVLEDAFGKLTLAAFCDTLLPKLIFGELRVRDAGRFINKHP
jgi:hypothetical protein